MHVYIYIYIYIYVDLRETDLVYKICKQAKMLIPGLLPSSACSLLCPELVAVNTHLVIILMVVAT